MRSTIKNSLTPVARLLVLLCLPVSLALAQQPQQPPNLEPLPKDQVPMPPQMKIDPSQEPEVTVTKRGEDKVEEFRVGGRLYMIRVTPPNAPPYVLVDNDGSGTFGPSAGPADNVGNLRVPMWVLGRF